MDKQNKREMPEWLLPSMAYRGRCVLLKYKTECRQSAEKKPPSRAKKGTKHLMLLGLLAGIIGLCPFNESRADSPASDPWYYVSKNEYRFAVPDKFQHFYGSAALTGIMGPMPALALGVSKEVYDDTQARVGFSMRDIAADVLGILAAKLSSTKDVSLWLDWSPAGEALVLQIGFSF